MIRWIIEQSIKNRFLVLLLTAALIAASIYGVYHLKLDAIPDLSDAQVIMGKDEKALLRLWREKRGEEPSPDLSNVLTVQLGLATEDLNRRLYELNSGYRIADVQRLAIHRTIPWMVATLDGLVEETGASSSESGVGPPSACGRSMLARTRTTSPAAKRDARGFVPLA